MGSLLASLAAIVCGVSFTGLPASWHQSRPSCTTFSHGTSDGNTDTWAARPRSVNNLIGFPRSGIYIWVLLQRPTPRVRGRPVHAPLRLGDANVFAQEGHPRLPEYRFEGRYRQQYEAIVGVDFGHAHPSKGERAEAQHVLNGMVWPRWR
jgi:hypothetical protein